MTGKEALRILSECANGEKKLLFSDSLDLEQIVSKELDELTKYKRAFEILKYKLEFENLGEMQNGVMFRGYFEDCFSEEEYELIEELMGNEDTK